MTDLLRMDFRRIIKSKSTYICFLALLATIIICVLLLKVVADPQLRTAAQGQGVAINVNEDAAVESLFNITYTDAFSSTIFRGGIFFVVISSLLSLWICTDFDSGFAKNIFAIRASRWSYILSKWVAIQTVSLLYITALTGIFLLACQAMGLTFKEAPAEDYVKFILIYWILGGAYAAMLTVLSVLLRNKAACIASALLLGSGTVLTAVDAILTALRIHVYNSFDYTLYGCVQDIIFPVTQEKFTLCIVIGIIWLIFWLFLSIFIIHKKDI